MPQLHLRAHAVMRISLVVPTYREPAPETWLPRLARAADEVVVVDDSDDATHAALAAFAPPNVRVLRGDRRGKGDAVRVGMLAAEGDVVFHLDADLDDEKLALIPSLARLIAEEQYDVAITERRSRWQYRNAARFVLSIGLFLAQRVFIFHSTRFFDTQCGLKAFRSDVARTLASLQSVRGGMYDIEYLYIAVQRGLRIAQVPVEPMRELRPSRIRLLRCLVDDPFDLLRVKWNGIRGRYRDGGWRMEDGRSMSPGTAGGLRPSAIRHLPSVSVTNRIRYVLDELTPHFLRDARWFMWPFFFVWFKGRNVREAMDFKQLAPLMSDAELRDFYRGVVTLGDRRVTDTNTDAQAFAVASIPPDARSLLDVGCGRGTFLRQLRSRRRPVILSRADGEGSPDRAPGGGSFGVFAPQDDTRLVGCDLRDRSDFKPYVNASAERLPFVDNAFDVVMSFHTLEHTRDLRAAVAELRRVARRQLIIVVPRQKRFKYTMDLHLHFFETPDMLREALNMPGTIRQFGSDLVYISDPT